MFKRFKEIVKQEWNIVVPDNLDLDMSLLSFAEGLSCQTEGYEFNEENVKTVYNLNIGHPSLHLPGLISFTIVLELGLNPHKVRSTLPLRDIFDMKNE